MKALIVVKPHGEMVLDGSKTMIVQDERLSELIGKSVLLVEGDAAIGEVVLKEPKEITVREFDGLRNQHQISDNERRRWWPDARKLNAHEFVFKAFDKPRRVARERGPRMVTGEVIFKTQEYYDLLKRVFGNALAKYTDQDLVQVHRLLHIFFNRKTGGEKVVIEGQPRSVEDIINRHVLVVQEMGRRGFEHHEDEDELNRLSKPFMKDLAPVNPSGQGSGKPKARIEDIFKYFDKPIILHKGAVVFTGGVVNNGESDNDLDVLARIPSIDELLRRLYFRLLRSLPEGHPLKESLHLIGNDPAGPFTSFIPAYDLALIPGEMKVVRMSQEEASLDIVKQRAASEKVKEEAQTSLKDDSVTPTRFFIPMKPTKGALPEQRQSVENFLALFEPEDFPVYSSKKYDGARHTVFIKDTPAGTGVKIMSEDGEDNTSRFPGAVKAFRDLKVGAGAVLDCEVELWDEDGKHYPREAVAAYAHSNEPADDSRIVFNVFDLLYLDGADIHKQSLEERLNKLLSIGIQQSTVEEPDLKQRLNLVPHFKSESIDGLKNDTMKLLATPGSEGNVAKKAGSVYYLDGNSHEGWVKFHKSAVLVGIVVERVETKTPGTYNYRFALDAGDQKVNPADVVDVGGTEYVEVGKTFSTSIKADVGELLEVEFETFNWTIDSDGVISVSAWAPRVMHIVLGEDGEPYTIDDAYQTAQEMNVLQIKEIDEQGEVIYKTLTLITKGVRPAFGSPGGKRWAAEKVARMLPKHTTYIEPFIGGGAVFWKKNPSEKEIINDRDPEIAFAYRFLKKVTPEDIKKLGSFDWVLRKKKWQEINSGNSKPSTDVERFYNFLYNLKGSYSLGRHSYQPFMEGKSLRPSFNWEAMKNRMTDVEVFNKDWWDVVSDHNSPSTFVYLDPPYPGEWTGPKKTDFTEEQLQSMRDRMNNFKGKFILSINLSPKTTDLFKGFNQTRIKMPKLFNHNTTAANDNKRPFEYELLVSNFDIKESNDWLEKRLGLGLDVEPLVKQSDPYMVNPNEEEKYSYVCQHHYRGRSAHVDLRAENAGKKFLIGWTIADLIPDAIKNPVESLADARAEDAKNSNWKVDWKTGKFKDRETRSGNIVAAQLRAFEKAPEPVDWINVEGVTQPFPAPGSTKEYRGVFSIIDSGSIEYGAQKLDTHEYFLSGKLNGRLVIRRLARETISEGLALPPGVEEGSETTSTFWVAIQPDDQTPIVLTKREVEKGWMPPDGISALPEELRKKIPPKYRYWEKKGEEARKVRDSLVADIDSVLKAGEADYVLQFHGFRTPGAKPVREGMTEYHWDFRVDKGGKTLDHFVLENNPLTSEMVSATFKQDEWKDAIGYQGNPEPGHPMNPTKASAATVSILDHGKIIILIDNPTFKKYDIHDGEMRGLWVAQRDDDKTPHWRFGKSQRVEAR